MTPDFDPGDDPLAPGSPLRMAQNAIYAAAVPEPSTLLMAALGAATLLLVRCRRQR
jgi:hypothetical protein